MILFNQHDFNQYVQNNMGRAAAVRQAWAVSRSDHNRLMSVPQDGPMLIPSGAFVINFGDGCDRDSSYRRLLEFLRDNLDKFEVGGKYFVVTLCTPNRTAWCWLEPNTLPQPVRSQDKDFGVG